MKKIFIVKYKESPKKKTITREIEAWNESDARLKIKFEKETTLNQIVYINIKEKKSNIRIQPKERKNKVLPYPFFINEKGLVERQDFWKGKPYKLIGFSPIKEQKFDKKQIDLKIFLETPKKAIGMYPIFEHKNKEWYTYQDKIESVDII